jgi:hypothetical protein
VDSPICRPQSAEGVRREVELAKEREAKDLRWKLVKLIG